jgi:MFS family permease
VDGRDNQTGEAGLGPTTGVQSRLAAWWQTHQWARKHGREHSSRRAWLSGILPSPWLARPQRDPSPRRGGQGGVGVLGARFWLFAAVGTVFALGNSSDAFLFLRTEGLEASLVAVPLVYFAFNVVYALLATPLGSLSDRFGRLPVLALGYAAFTLVYLGWTRASAPWHVWALFAVYGAYYAATEGVARAFVADLVPRGRRGTALGWYGALTGLAALPANIVGAWLWTQYGPGITFALGAWLGATALGLLLAWWPWLRDPTRALS